MSQIFYIALLVVLIISVGIPPANAIDINRRRILQTGLFSFFMPKVPLASIPSPAPVAEITNVTVSAESLTRYRTESIAALLKRQIFSWNHDAKVEGSGSQLGVAEMDILEDWLRQNFPGSERVANNYKEFLQVFKQLRETPSKIENNAKYDALWARMNDLRKEIDSGVTQSPWAEKDWTRVFSNQIAKAEMELALQFNAPISEVFRSFEQMLEFAFPHMDHSRSLTVDIGNVDFLKHSLPLYSEEFVAEACLKMQKFAPHFAAFVKEKNSKVDPEMFKRSLVHASGFMDYVSSWHLPLNFSFTHYGLNSVFKKDYSLEKLAPFYIRAHDYFLMVKSHIEKLHPSDFKTVAENVVAELMEELTTEVQTLPQRLTAIKGSNPEEKIWDDPEGSLNKSLSPAEISSTSVEWINFLRTLNGSVGLVQALSGLAKNAESIDVALDPVATDTAGLEMSCPQLLIANHSQVPFEVQHVEKVAVPAQEEKLE